MAVGDARDDLRVAKDGDKPDIKSLINELMEDKRGKHQNIVRICKNLGLMVFYNNVVKNGFELKDEILNFGVSGHDDCVDSLVWLCNGLMSKGKLELEY